PLDRKSPIQVRIHSAPADSPCLAQTQPPQVENRGFPAGVRRWAGGALGRDAQTLAGSARTGTDVSIGSYSSTAMVLTWSRAITAAPPSPAAVGLNTNVFQPALQKNLLRRRVTGVGIGADRFQAEGLEPVIDDGRGRFPGV